jgi:hypothetical protein
VVDDCARWSRRNLRLVPDAACWFGAKQLRRRDLVEIIRAKFGSSARWYSGIWF